MSAGNILLVALLILFNACGTSRPFYKSAVDSVPDPSNKQVDYSLFLIGDTGAPYQSGAGEVLQTLRYQLSRAGESSSVVFLGDNIYPDGMPPDSSYEDRVASENNLKPALDALSDYRGKSYFLPGNHDWRYGVEGMKAQEDFIETYTAGAAEFAPDNGCPGPSGYDLGRNWYLIILDSEWWINRSLETTAADEDCESQERAEVINRTGTIIDNNSDKNILIAFHHSLYSNGNHGGYYSFREHLFPLASLVDNLYMPLPLIGSAYPLYRKLGLSGQDIPHVQYQAFKKEILEAAENVENVFFAAGHEHSLSFYEKEKPAVNKEGQDFFILSGSGSKVSYSRGRNGAEFVHSHRGFAKLLSYKDGSVAVEFWIPDNGKAEGKLVYRKQLVEPTIPQDQEKEEGGSGKKRETAGIRKDTVSVAAGPLYRAGNFKRFFWGDHYRDAWTTRVDVPILDFETERGGLDILARTGGVQTVTIIAEDSTGSRYVMRSVQKDPKRSLPEILQETFVTDIAQDQTSATHPYGSMVASALASAAGVYHTTPELRYIPGQSEFNLDAGNKDGTLVTVEEFVSSQWFNQTYDKEAVDVVDSYNLWNALRTGSPATIDERQLVRSRIFDMFIGDWDRHEEQWFWAKVPTDSIPVFQPVPIDRDNAFYKSDGLVLGLAQLWAFPKFQYFGEDIRNIKGINLNGQYFDRWFINKLNKKEWIGIAEQMEKSLTDSMIVQAVEQWPEPIVDLNGDTFIRKLKARRAKLTDFARRYYDLLVREVNIYGSDEPEEFIVERKLKGETSVTMYRRDAAGKRQVAYHRIFKKEETNEIRLYGFGGDDLFEIKGKGNKEIKIRVIGGEGDDVIKDQPAVSGIGKKTWVYDTEKGSTIETDGTVKDKTSSNPRVNRYEKRAFEYNFAGPLFTTGYNENDGLFLGGGLLIRRQGFRKKPFASRHRITGKAAMRTIAFSLSYDGIFTDIVGPFNIEIDAEVQAPNYSVNFFGMGNETEKQDISTGFYGYRMDRADIEGSLSNEIADLLTIHGGVGMQYYRPFDMKNRFVTSPGSGLDNVVFNDHYYATMGSGFTVNTVDSGVFPKYGVVFDFKSELMLGINGRSDSFGRISTEGKFYHTFEDITTTLASRVGFSTNIGPYKFFQANTLGGQSFTGNSNNLRGFLRDRFSGRTALFQNTELRTRLFDVQSYILPAAVGILAYVDEGRVWVDNESSTRWHVNYGGGIWISPLKRVVLTGGLAFSTEETLLTLTLGFPF